MYYSNSKYISKTLRAVEFVKNVTLPTTWKLHFLKTVVVTLR